MASTYLNRQCDATASSGYSLTWTWSGWVKRSKTGEEQGIFQNKKDAHVSASRFRMSFGSSDKLLWECKDSTSNDDNSFETNMLFRDTNAWYHIVFSYDSTQSTEADRLKLWVNGVDIRNNGGGFSSINEASNGFGTLWSSASKHFIGYTSNNSGTAFKMNGCMSHVHLTYGTAYSASTFGSTDSTTGEWRINTSPSVTYGSQGYFMLKDNASVTDQSGEGNNFTASGTLTKTEDCPSNVFCTLNGIIPQAGGVSGRDGSASTSLDNGNTTAGEGAAVFSNQVGTIFASSGKYYAECKFGGDQYCSFGVASPNFSDASLGSYPGASITGVNTAGIYGNGGIARVNGSTIFTDSNITTDTICLAMDLDNGALYIRRNDSAWMNSGNPESGATKTGAVTLPSDTYTWIVTSHNNSGSGRNYMKVNFGNGYFGTTAVSSAGTNASGNGIFEYDVPSGYTALSTKGLNL